MPGDAITLIWDAGVCAEGEPFERFWSGEIFSYFSRASAKDHSDNLASCCPARNGRRISTAASFTQAERTRDSPFTEELAARGRNWV